ncbi:MAG: chromosomal replication initiator protein DnaA, partial [Propionibacterium sp.]
MVQYQRLQEGILPNSSGSETSWVNKSVDTNELDALWSRLIESVTDMPTRSLLRRTKPVAAHGSTIMLAVENNFTRERVELKLRSLIEDELTNLLNTPTSLAVLVDPELEIQEPEPVTTPATAEQLPSDQETQTGDGKTEAGLNSRYTFETFVCGSSNRFAHAAANAAAEAPGTSYNPLMIYGSSGLGKTHLLHAIGHYVRSYYDHLRIKYVSTEELTNDFINSIAENRTASFRRNYRDIDVLLIDDIQFLESKVQTQEEFFHTFNTLHNAQKQIVMTSDRPPHLLEGVDERLVTRFGWGLVTDIQPPDLETRIAILRRKAAAERLTASSEVLEFIASKIQANIRELEGALIRVTAFASLNQQDVDVELAKNVLKDIIPTETLQVSAKTILAQTSAYFEVSIDELTGPNRSQAIAQARQISMYLCREMTDLSLPKIGQLFGGRDHTTVMHA